MVVFLAVLYWSRDLIHADRFHLVADSPLDRATTVLIRLLEEHGDLWDDVDRSAVKIARRLDEHFTRLGYFRQVVMPSMAAAS